MLKSCLVVGAVLSTVTVTAAIVWCCLPGKVKDVTPKKPKHPFQFQVLNDSMTESKKALVTALATDASHKLSLDATGILLLKRVTTDVKSCVDEHKQQRAQANTFNFKTLVEDSETLVHVGVNLIAFDKDEKKGKNENKDQEQNQPTDIVSVTLEASSSNILVKTRHSSTRQIVQTLVRRTAFVFDFTDNQKSKMKLDLLIKFVDLVMHCGVPGKDRVVIRLESGGGRVDQYGLAAAQLERLRRKGFYLVVLIDSIGASGGFLMASVAHRIIAAPFATVGSIGVVMQFFNMYKLLQRCDVVEKTFTAGEDKRLMSQFSDYGEEADVKLKKHLRDVHMQFRQFITQYRPNIDIDVVGTGGTWLAHDALDHGLVDEIMTSNEYLSTLMHEFTVVQVSARVTSHVPSSLWSIIFGKNSRSNDEDEEQASVDNADSDAHSDSPSSMLLSTVIRRVVQALATSSLDIHQQTRHAALRFE